MKRKGLKMLLYIFLLLIGMCYGNMRISRKIKGEKTFREVVRVLKENNLIIDGDDYSVRFIKCYTSPGGITCTNSYGAIRKGYRYRSGYFDNRKNYYYFFTDHMSNEVFKIFDERRLYFELVDAVEVFGLNPYVLDRFIYDVSKGNRFEEIEKIFDSYGKGKIRYRWKNFYLRCVNMEDKAHFKEVESIPEYECEERDWGKMYRKYFNVPRELDRIDWEEYMKVHRLYPVLEFEAKGFTEEEIGEINRKIAPYYNRDLLYIYAKS